MGVPAFFRWLSRKYPSVIVYCVEEKAKVIERVVVPVDSSKPNPNNIEFDNLYLDMNGIIHPCTHPEDKPAPKDEDEMMVAIFECIDRLFAIVRPRKVLYMAIDGVAPRAKMNQQRSRRFRASKETAEKVEEVARLREQLLAKGAYLPPEKPKEAHFDSNCITPGTPFMARLSASLHYYIHDRLNNDPGWKGIKVILSDANVPGEGEHKIMDYIRKQRSQPDHDPNTKHCLCGADADLIMLGLATHEPNFYIIREEFKPNKPRPCDICAQVGHEMKDCVGIPKPVDGAEDAPSFGEETPFIFVCLNVLREYLEKELVMPGLPFRYDFERAVDDWVFMCFFVGNDFLPHLPSLEIREGAIDRLVNLYKDCVFKTGGYITDSGNVNLSRVQLILNELGKVEDEIFKKRQQTELMFRQREKQKKRRMAQQNSGGRPSFTPTGQFAPTPLGAGRRPDIVENPRFEAFRGRTQGYHSQMQGGNIGNFLRREGQGGGSGTSQKFGGTDMNAEEEQEEEEPPDEVRLWEDGFKDRYYESKFDVDKSNLEFRVKVGHQYVRGLCWVLKYYYQGCASWKWYFPYHYAPFASDFIDVGELSSEFEKNTVPFRPLEQLMGVFPAASSSHVPKPWAELMSDPFSSIIDFYPIDFKIDLNGKKFAWQGVALLPFVDEKRLFKALEPYYLQLTPAEKLRNIRGDDRLYVGPTNGGYTFINGLYKNQVPFDDEVAITVDGMKGSVLLSNDCLDIDGNMVSPVKGLHNIEQNHVLCVRFRDPKYSVDFIFKAKRLKGAIEPKRVLKPGDLSSLESNNWKPRLGLGQRTQGAQLGNAGHRMVNFHTQQGQYSQVPPPMMAPNQHRQHGRYGQGFQNQQGGPYRNASGYNDNNRGGGRDNNNSNWRDRSQGGYSGNNNSGYGNNRGYNNSNRGYSARNNTGDNDNNRGYSARNNTGGYNDNNRRYSANNTVGQYSENTQGYFTREHAESGNSSRGNNDSGYSSFNSRDSSYSNRDNNNWTQNRNNSSGYNRY